MKRSELMSAIEPPQEEKGKAVIEFALILPFLALTILASMDASDALRAHQYMSVAARDTAAAAYRNCVQASNGAPMDACLQQAAASALHYLTGPSGVLPGVKAGVSLYRVQFTGAAPCPQLAGSYRSDPGLATRYTLSSISSLNSYLPGKEAILTVELFYQKTGFTRYFSRRFYETMVI